MSLQTRRERRAKERQERSRRARAPITHASPRVRSTWIAAGVLAAAVALVLGVMAFGAVRTGPATTFDLRDRKYDIQGEVIGSHMPDESNAHVPAGQKVTYQTDPPTSGSHWGAPAAPAPWGIKDTTLPNEVIMHNMEHGGVIVFYKGLSDDELIKLKDLVRTLSQNGFPKLILEPYSALTDARVALSAWRWQLKLPGYDDAQVVKFVRSHYQGPDAPEPQAQ